MPDTDRLAALLRDVLGPLMVGSTLTDAAYRNVAARLIAAGVTNAAPAEGLREAAFRVVTNTDNLRHWDEAHGHVINSERDEIAGWLDAAWDDLRAALAAPAEGQK